MDDDDESNGSCDILRTGVCGDRRDEPLDDAIEDNGWDACILFRVVEYCLVNGDASARLLPEYVCINEK